MESKTTNKQKVEVFQSESIRDIVDTLNNKGIKTEDIISILQDARSNDFVLLYYI